MIRLLTAANTGNRLGIPVFLIGIVIFLLGFTAPTSAAGESLIIEHGKRDKRIALTFDACPTSLPDEYDKQVVDILLREKVPATLFLSGRWVEKNPDKAKYLADQKEFEIAAHSYWHPHLLEKDDARVLREMKRTQAIIKKVTGKTPRYFRPPYGEVDERVAKLAKEAGLVTIQYDIASGDPDPALSTERIVRSVLREAKGGSIIVFHMNKRGVHTADSLPAIIKGLRDKGFTLVTVGEMLKE
ncbi:MAG TPA: polysaccharide deacetylase family protein [Nitrospirota bacterium]|nr:polysaccharide deacetylase family protein [Nitrospirota bacterium]